VGEAQGGCQGEEGGSRGRVEEVRRGLGAVVLNCCELRVLHPSTGLEAGVERRFSGYHVDLQLRVRLARNLVLRSQPQGGHKRKPGFTGNAMFLSHEFDTVSLIPSPHVPAWWLWSKVEGVLVVSSPRPCEPRPFSLLDQASRRLAGIIMLIPTVWLSGGNVEEPTIAGRRRLVVLPAGRTTPW
jgi:hypothetical protein